MKIRKLNDDWNYGIPVMCQMIVALKEARAVSPACMGSGEFQSRSADAILALVNKLMEEYVERFYVPETKKFLVTYDVKRSGAGELVVEAKDEVEAKAKAESQLRNDLGPDWLDKRKTELVAADIVDAKEYRDGQA